MTGFEVYQVYLALKNHFTKTDYDYIKYRGKTRVTEKSFDGRNDVYFFKKLGTKYSQTEIVNYFVSQLLLDSRGYIRNFSDDTYKNWKIHQESFTYKFKQDVDFLLDDVGAPYETNFENIFKIKRGEHPHILRRYYAGDISLETLVVFETCLGFIKRFDKSLTDPIWKETRLKILKYAPFLNVDCKRYRSIVLETIRTKL